MSRSVFTKDDANFTKSQVRRSSGNQDPAALRDSATDAVKAYLSGDEAQKAQAETKAADALAKAQGIPVDQARTQIQDYKKQYEQTAADAKQKAQAAAEATRRFAGGALRGTGPRPRCPRRLLRRPHRRRETGRARRPQHHRASCLTPTVLYRNK